MSRLSRLLLVLSLLLLPALGVAACGGDDGGGNSGDSVDAVLKDTFGPDKPIRSGDLRLAVDLDLQGVQGLSGPVKLALRGPFQSNGREKLPDFDFTLDVNAGGSSFAAGAVSTGEKGFLKLQGTTFDLGDQLFEQFRNGYEQAQKEATGDNEEDAPSFSSLGIDPLRWLRDPQRVGTEEVGGTETIHVKASVDVAKVLEDVSKLLEKAQGLNIQGAGEVPDALTAEQRRQIAEAVKSTSMEVWTGEDDRTLRRLKVAVGLDVPEGTRSSVGGLTGGTIGFDLTFNELNEDQEVKAPSNARPLSELTGALGGVIPGAGGDGSTGSGSGASGGTTTAPASGTANAPKEYLDCVAKAGQDVAKIQECGQFLR